MSLFECDSYKEFVLNYVNSQQKRGAFRKIAECIGVNSSMVSQIFRGPSELNPDQAFVLSEFFGFNPLERDYFLLLVQRERATNSGLKQDLNEKIKQLRLKTTDVSLRVSPHVTLTDSDQAIFYADWTYSAIRLATSLPQMGTVEAISDYFKLPKSRVKSVLDWLVNRGLCTEKSGQYGVGLSKTHLPANSPVISRHHGNWRLRAMQHHPLLSSEELAFSSPMTLSRDDFQRVKQLLLDTVQGTHKILAPSQNEMLACLNIDWFEIGFI